MRSRPFTSPPPKAIGLSSNYNPNRIYRLTSIVNNEAVPLAGSDLEKTQLLPRRERRHHVRIQGRLALVRAVSVADLQHANNGYPTAITDINCEDMRGSLLRRRGSYDGSEADDENHKEDHAMKCDAQFRGYGIGGAGNIRKQSADGRHVKCVAITVILNSRFHFSAYSPIKGHEAQ
ncbi:hypothetical protein F4859DRAFT_518261 [Xylaria cf. heliscus]|nr:hypothetical protein F4859DRAFT_518261 [Xylaria cf. heliscus]